MPRPRGFDRTHINIAPPAEVVEAVRRYAAQLSVPMVNIWELAARMYLKVNKAEIGPPTRRGLEGEE